MPMTLIGGYIVTDSSGVIYGTGDTKQSAWDDAIHELSQAGISVLTDDDDSSAQLGGWTLAGELEIIPATAWLIANVRDRGGAIPWSEIGRVACAIEEVGP